MLVLATHVLYDAIRGYTGDIGESHAQFDEGGAAPLDTTLMTARASTDRGTAPNGVVNGGPG